MSEGSINGPAPNQRPEGNQGATERSSSPAGAENTAGDTRSRGDRRLGDALAEARQTQRGQPRNQNQRDELDNAVSRLNDFVQSVQRDLAFEVHDETGQTVVKVIDPQTDQVVRQIPDELALKLAENLQQDEPIALLNIRV